MWKVPSLEITDEERSELERRVRAQKTAQRMVRRCRIVLLASEGVPNRRIAPVVAMSENQVGVWRKRFERDRLSGLDDRPRTGRPRLYDGDVRVRIVAKATEEKTRGRLALVAPADRARPRRHRDLRVPGGEDPRGSRHQAPPVALVAHPTRGSGVLPPCWGRLWALTSRRPSPPSCSRSTRRRSSRRSPGGTQRACAARRGRARRVRIPPTRHGELHRRACRPLR